LQYGEVLEIVDIYLKLIFGSSFQLTEN